MNDREPEDDEARRAAAELTRLLMQQRARERELAAARADRRQIGLPLHRVTGAGHE